MKWMLIVAVFGGAPVKTNLLFDTLNDCLDAELAMREEIAVAVNKTDEWAKANSKKANYPASREFQHRRIGLKHVGTCIPHGEISD